MKKIRSILIANRGEIAIRIQKTAKRMELETWCLQTAQEPNALYLKNADRILQVPGEVAAKSVFLDVEALVGYAVDNHIDALHPGYGFLAENPELAKRCAENGIVFIGPSEASIRQMGDKNEAKKLAVSVGMPVPSGSTQPILMVDAAIEQAQICGYPVMLKALAGGGGKGMRVVRNENEMKQIFSMAVNEAFNAFGDGAMLVEKYIENPRHIEVQVLADQHGNAVHLFERECSIQRNHQKLLEEAPSVALDEALRAKMTACALDLCRASGYYTLGTIEFLLDADKNFYFLEMNTRIQVEHPVTEAISGLDLVELQIRAALGEPLGLKQKDIRKKGWALELRINAEDVQAGFAPSFGIIDCLDIPVDAHVRLDAGYSAGSVLPALFDSLVAKVIVTGRNRKETLKRATKVLQSTRIKGIRTTVPFLLAVLHDQNFQDGTFTTSFVGSMEKLNHQEKDEARAAAMIALQAYLDDVGMVENQQIGAADTSSADPWKSKKWLKMI